MYDINLESTWTSQTMKKAKSENILVCLICREEEAEFLTCCNHNFHEECLKKWHMRIKNECPYCRSFITLNRKLNLFLKNIQNKDYDTEIVIEEEDSGEIFAYLNEPEEKADQPRSAPAAKSVDNIDEDVPF